jgi:hypothetical protein
MSRTRLLLAGMAAALMLSVVVAPVAMGKGRPLQATLVGANEAPGPGDEDGSGTAKLRLNQGRQRICYTLSVSDITLPAVGAHIHTGAAGVAGDVVVTLEPPDATGVSTGCVTGVERSLIKAIRKHPADYYVNVHTTDFLDGAVRGQLAKWAPGRH